MLRSEFFPLVMDRIIGNEKEISTTVYGDSDLKNGRQDYRQEIERLMMIVRRYQQQGRRRVYARCVVT